MGGQQNLFFARTYSKLMNKFPIPRLAMRVSGCSRGSYSTEHMECSRTCNLHSSILPLTLWIKRPMI